MRAINRLVRNAAAGVIAAGYLAASSVASAAQLNISDVPLFLGSAIKPNVMFTLDDSGSMYWSYMPDDIYGLWNSRRGMAASVNRLAYDPAITYDPPLKADGQPMPNADFNAAWEDGYAAYRGRSTCTFNLANNFRPSWYYGDNCDGSTGTNEFWGNNAPATSAFYYVYYLDHPAGPQPAPTSCSTPDRNNGFCYIQVNVGAAEEQNFANWYSYYRRRIYMAKAGVGRAFANQGASLRVGYGSINDGTRTIDGVSTPVVARGVRDFSGTDKQAFFNYLYDSEATGGTPLRQAADAVGQYFSRTDARSPWNTDPTSSTSGKDLSCQTAYHVLMSDGYWNGNDPANVTGNPDGTNGPSHTSPDGSKTFTYSAVSPYTDNWSRTLADVAMHYWKNDLRTDLPDQVPTNSADPAFWQHLTTFTVGLGVTGTISPALVASGATINWPQPSPAISGARPENIDDMLHAAVNARGEFLNASDPVSFANALSAVLKSIAARESTAASVALNSTTLSSGSLVYQAKFNSKYWTGSIEAFSVFNNLAPVATFDSDNIPSANIRRIVTYDPATDSGIPFRWANLTATQKALLDNASASNSSSPILDYLRGDQSREDNQTGYRERPSLFGDIINSAPAYLGPPSAPYFNYWGPSAPENAATYADFRFTHVNRQPMLVVGANDGMLHILDANTGAEIFTYVPSMLMGKLADLSDPNYDHNAYVDGSPTVGDVFYQGAWHTVVVGGLGAGGQGIYALELTTVPASGASEGTIAARVLWEFSDADDADLGYTFSTPNIVRMQNGRWAAVFGNGYNNTEADTAASTTGDAALYVVDIETGSLIKKITTKAGAAEDPLGSSRPNGLASVAPADVDGDFIVDYVYGGDLFGNMWKFDLSSDNTSHWSSAYGSGSNPAPLFTARFNPSNAATAQPITSRPQIVGHPAGLGGVLVLFGTGKFFELGDNQTTGQTTQTFYGVWDRGDNHAAFTRGDLLEQQIESEQTVQGRDYRLTSKHPITWRTPTSGTSGSLGWYMDLYNQDGGNTQNFGERVVADPVVRGDRVIFVTLLPSEDPCGFGGDGWLMVLDPGSGERLDRSPFDVNQDGVFDANDFIDPDGTSGSAPDQAGSGTKFNIGITPTPRFMTDMSGQTSGGGSGPPSCGGNQELILSVGSSGAMDLSRTSTGGDECSRQSWRQLK